VRAFDADRINRTLYIVMEYVPGYSLGDRLKRGPIPVGEMIDYAAQAALGLAHAHEQGMVHRDIKPSNILVTLDKKVKILDLGLGLLLEADSNATFATADGIAVGTVDYMSPEQALGRDIDGRSDLFSLGCAMYHLMTGKLAYPGESPIDRLGRRISARPVPISEHIPDIPSSVVRVLDKLMAYKPQDRFASAIEASEALQYLIRPRTRPSAQARAPASPPPSPAPGLEARETPAPPSTPPSALAAVPSPKYPGWFKPVARLVERRPTTALLVGLACLAAVFASGLAVGYLVK
jgi:serine/threonine-protein kinase